MDILVSPKYAIVLKACLHYFGYMLYSKGSKLPFSLSMMYLWGSNLCNETELSSSCWLCVQSPLDYGSFTVSHGTLKMGMGTPGDRDVRLSRWAYSIALVSKDSIVISTAHQ